MPFRILSTSGAQSFEIEDGCDLVIGRAASSDIPIFDRTISRRHARLSSSASGVEVSDLGSSNGTFLNGVRVEHAVVSVGDELTFGSVAFRLESCEAPLPRVSPAEESATSATPSSGAAVIKQRAFNSPDGLLSSVFRGGNLAEAKVDQAMLHGAARTEKKLAILLEVSKGLSRAVDVNALLDKITELVFQILDVDRVAIELVDESGARVPTIARDRHGPITRKAVPRSIARMVVEEKVAVLSDNASEDGRFGGQSILTQSVRSAMCAPLIGTEDVVQGVLYVDNVTTTHRFGDEDLDFLIAFSNIAAVALENSRFAERIRRETMVRGNFERFFAPRLAAQIAGSAHQLKLGGDKSTVAVLFSDIRGFTALSEAMKPDDVARLLSEYFTVMVEVVFRHGGTLDKFIGDAVMAEWGAPIGAPDDADRAMAAALDMMRELATLNERWKREGRPLLDIGIGLSFGESFAGYIGSERRLEYTVIGDVVNIASRLCSEAAAGEILLTDAMRAALSAAPPMRECDPMELKGKTRSIPVFSVSA
jgi:adenylate cyclase